ncbi:MAG: hypothetical protein R3C39_05280 [Dehalococcoidia bacterium]
MTRGKRSWLVAWLLAGALAATAGCFGGDDGGGAPASGIDRGSLVLPDLVPGLTGDLTMLEAPDGTRLLLFSSSLENRGAGAFRLVGDEERIEQVVTDASGREARTPITGVLQFGQDGSERWLFRGLLSFRLTSDDGNGGRTLHATGYAALCVYDALPIESGRPGNDDGCGDADEASVDMHLSPGFRVEAPWYQPGLSVDMTGLADGRYRLEALVYPGAMVAESDLTNNRQVLDFEVRSGSPLGPTIVLDEPS